MVAYRAVEPAANRASASIVPGHIPERETLDGVPSDCTCRVDAEEPQRTKQLRSPRHGEEREIRSVRRAPMRRPDSRELSDDSQSFRFRLGVDVKAGSVLTVPAKRRLAFGAKRSRG